MYSFYLQCGDLILAVTSDRFSRFVRVEPEEPQHSGAQVTSYSEGPFVRDIDSPDVRRTVVTIPCINVTSIIEIPTMNVQTHPLFARWTIRYLNR